MNDMLKQPIRVRKSIDETTLPNYTDGKIYWSVDQYITWSENGKGACHALEHGGDLPRFATSADKKTSKRYETDF